jgi:hypothetical protein
LSAAKRRLLRMRCLKLTGACRSEGSQPKRQRCAFSVNHVPSSHRQQQQQQQQQLDFSLRM